MTTAVTVSLAPTRAIGIALSGAGGTLTLATDDTALALLLAPIYRGPKGDSGPSGSIPLELDQVAITGLNTINVPVPFVTSATRLFINGLRQSPSAYTISGQVVTLPTTLNCIAGDALSFEYLPS